MRMCNFVTFRTESTGFGASLFGEVLATCKKKVSQYTCADHVALGKKWSSSPVSHRELGKKWPEDAETLPSGLQAV